MKSQWQERESGIQLCSSFCHRDGRPTFNRIKRRNKYGVKVWEHFPEKKSTGTNQSISFLTQGYLTEKCGKANNSGMTIQMLIYVLHEK
jgi:hypothetical protein